MELPLRLVRALNTLFRSPHKLLSRLGASNHESGRGLRYVTPPYLISLRNLLSTTMLIIYATGLQADLLVEIRIVAYAILHSIPTWIDNPGILSTMRLSQTPSLTEACPGSWNRDQHER